MAVNASLDLISENNDYYAWVGKVATESWYPQFTVFHCVDELLLNNKLPSFIVISLPAESQDEALQVLRARNLTSHALIFVLHESALSPYLANELWQPNYELDLQTYAIRRRRLKIDYQDDNELKLISYLWIHGNKALTPHPVTNEKQLYDYPLLKCWQLRPEESFQLLNQLVSRKWLHVDKVYNRVRFCPFCFSGHMNFLDVCPECDSPDVLASHLLQCKKCHHIDKKSHFGKNGAKVCPNCNTSLTNIDKDYIIPAEKLKCKDCGSNFVSTETKIQCLHCESLCAINVPHIQNICSYNLASMAKTIVHHGHQYRQIELTLGQSMPALQFYWLLKWQNSLAQRHDLQHVLMSITINNLNTLMKSHGELIGLTIMDSLQKQLNSIIRKTDACSHYTEEGLLLFLPMTTEKDIKHIHRRLSDIQPVDKGEQLKLGIKTIILPTEIDDDVVSWTRKRLANSSVIKPCK